MTSKVGPREQILRDMREQRSVAVLKKVAALKAALPATSGKKPVKRKKKR